MKQKVIVLLALISMLSPAGYSQRIITAGSAITETVCALGDCDKIVASDRTSLFPAAIQQLPSIGYRSGINAEGILSLKPAMIIAEKGYVEEDVLRQLSGSGIRLVIVEARYDFEDTRKCIRQIATALGKEAEGEKLIAQNEVALSEAAAILKQTSKRPTVLCIYNRGTSTVSAAGKQTFARMLDYAGAVNALPEISGYKPLNTESLIAANPDYLLMVSTGMESLGGVDGVLKIAGVAQTTAGKKKQIVALESLKLTNFGPRFGEAVKELVLLLHPELNSR
jgi:iron complex transport system substrate-binding protein